jgi:hypothetical protein
VKSINLQKVGITESNVSEIAFLLGKFENVEAIDVSDNETLGTSGAARLLEGLGRGVKSVSLKGTGLGLPVGGESVSPPGVGLDSSSSSTPPEREVCSDEDWTRLEGALRGLSALEAIDVSDNRALGTPGAARLLEGLGRGVKSVSLKGTGLLLAAGQVKLQYGQQRVFCSREVWTRFEGALRELSALEAIDFSDNRALGTPFAARLLEVVGRGVKSVSLKGTGLGLAAGQGLLFKKPVACSDDNLGRLEGALRGLSALEAIDFSDNETLGTSGVGRLVSCCAGEALLFVAT